MEMLLEKSGNPQNPGYPDLGSPLKPEVPLQNCFTTLQTEEETLVLMRDFNDPDICWRDNTAGHKQSRRFLECVSDNFLLQVIEELMRRGAMLDLVLINKEGLVGNVNLKGSLGCSDHEMVEFKILRAARRVHSKLTAPDFRRADFGLFRDLLGRIPWDKALDGGKKGTRKMVSIQGSPPPSSGATHPNKVRQKCQDDEKYLHG
ncbi:hypothetical protein GRJ2_000549100 [Grus japonensis]|uniref:Glycerol kinase n=1 Tax=Grus japonensis TaxID=30415 RepID=A0ABC9W6E1_GRUJA